VAIGLENISFHCNPKKGNAKECSNYRTIALISHTSKGMLKIPNPGLNPSLSHCRQTLYHLSQVFADLKAIDFLIVIICPVALL